MMLILVLEGSVLVLVLVLVGLVPVNITVGILCGLDSFHLRAWLTVINYWNSYLPPLI